MRREMRVSFQFVARVAPPFAQLMLSAQKVTRLLAPTPLWLANGAGIRP